MPLVLAIVFIVMNAMSLDLHRITLGALIIALGLLVDDAIIAVEMMVVKMEQGWDRIRAASFAWESTAFPMLTGTLVTAAGFLPIGFANSAVGEYAGGIFWIVAIALVASWFVAVIFTPYIGVKLLPNIKVHHNHDPHAVYETRVLSRPARAWCSGASTTASRWWLATVGVFVALDRRLRPRAAAVLPAVGAARTVPAAAPAGRHRVQRHREAVKKAEALLKDDKDIATYTAYVGQGSPRFWLGLNPQLPNEAFAEIVIVSKDVEARERIKAQAREGGRRRRADRGARARRPLQFRSAGRLPRPVPRHRPRRQQGARDRLQGARRHAAEPERQGRRSSTGTSSRPT